MLSSIPQDWEEIRFGKVAREVSARNRESNDIPVLSVTKHNGFVRSSEYFSRSVHSDDTSNYKVVRKGQFAYATIHLDEGSIALLKEFDRGIISPMYTVFETDADFVCSDYLFRCLKRFALSGRFDPYSNGGVNRRKSISFSDLQAFRFALPPLAEQRAIADVLDTVDDTIKLRESAIAAIANAKFAVMRQLLTRGVRLDRVPMKPLSERWILGRVAEGINEMPIDWQLITLTRVAKLESGHTPSRERPEYWGGDIPWLSLADTNALDALQVYQTAECVTSEGIANSSARILPKDTVAFSRTATVGKVTRLARPMATSQDFANWICGPRIRPDYLVQVFRHMKREWKRLQEGSTHQTIYMPVFKKLQVLLPSLEEQQKIATVGEAFDVQIESERAVVDALKANRDALSNELLSGRLRIPDKMIGIQRDRAEQAA
nr:restriction endonuclease subunit S [Rhizobium sullae]